MHKLIRYHPRMWISIGVGVLAFFLLPFPLSFVSRLLLSWNVGVILFIVLIFLGLSSLSAERIRVRYEEEDETAPFILMFVVAAAILSVVAIVEPLATLKQQTSLGRFAHMGLAALTLIDSWLLVPTMFTTHYADLFYSAPARARPLTFPNTPAPAFWDFAYFSFTIAAACQTSDVSTNGQQIRRTVLVQTLVAFFFNASILGFAINVTAGLIGGGG